MDAYTVAGNKRFIGNVTIKTDLVEPDTLVGFENHSGRTLINDYDSFGDVIVGYGNDGKKQKEGLVYKNVIGTYLHGPLLPKNPEVVDKLISLALKRRNINIELKALDDKEEMEAKNIMINRLKG